MLEKTNMSMVKLIAYELLKLPPIKTEYSPMIISHPFTNSGLFIMPVGNECKSMNIVDSMEDLKAWQAQMRNQIMSARSAIEISYMMNNAYLLTFLDKVKEHLSSKDYGEMLAYSWIKEESPNKDPNVAKSKLIKMFRQADKNYLMSDSERDEFSKFGDTMQIYRGVGRGKRMGSPNALSWTLDKSKAQWFASRYGEGDVFSATIDKKHILAYFGDSNESEVVVDYKYLQNVTTLSMNNDGLEYGDK